MKTLLFLLISSGFMFGCSGWRKTLIASGNTDDAVRNCITDYINTSRFFKRDTVFSISTKDINDDVLEVIIFGGPNRQYPGPKEKIGSYPRTKYAFPTKYAIYDGKLFYWNDSTKVITQDMVDVLLKYNHLDSLNVNGFVGFNDGWIDDGKQDQLYRICKNNLLNYKRGKTQTLDKRPKRPDVNCNKKK